jgi:hypothetical protein
MVARGKIAAQPLRVREGHRHSRTPFARHIEQPVSPALARVTAFDTIPRAAQVQTLTEETCGIDVAKWMNALRCARAPAKRSASSAGRPHFASRGPVLVIETREAVTLSAQPAVPTAALVTPAQQLSAMSSEKI